MRPAVTTARSRGSSVRKPGSSARPLAISSRRGARLCAPSAWMIQGTAFHKMVRPRAMPADCRKRRRFRAVPVGLSRDTKRGAASRGPGVSSRIRRLASVPPSSGSTCGRAKPDRDVPTVGLERRESRPGQQGSPAVAVLGRRQGREVTHEPSCLQPRVSTSVVHSDDRHCCRQRPGDPGRRPLLLGSPRSAREDGWRFSHSFRARQLVRAMVLTGTAGGRAGEPAGSGRRPAASDPR